MTFVGVKEALLVVNVSCLDYLKLPNRENNEHGTVSFYTGYPMRGKRDAEAAPDCK